MENGVHHTLEGGRGIGKAKEHDPRLEHASIGFESSLPFVAFLDMDVIVSPSYVELGEKGAAGEAVNGLRYERGYVMVLLGPSVDWAIILDWAELPVFLFDEEEVGGVWAPRFPDSSPC